ncbi:MAG: transposase DNA-binding-containing protein, partial [Bacteroidota bacterium]
MLNALETLHGQFNFDFGDRRLNRRCSDLAKHLQSSDLGLGFPGIFEQKHILKAFYRAMNNEKVS